MTINSRLKRFIVNLIFVVKCFFQKGLSDRAAALAYTTLLSIVPLSFLCFSLFSFFPKFQNVTQKLQQLVLDNFVTTSASSLSTYLTDFLHHTHSLSIINIVFLFLVGILMIYNINQAFNEVWGAPRDYHFSMSLLIYLIVLIGFPIIFLLLIVLNSIIKLFYFDHFLTTLFPYLTNLVIFTLCQWIFPSKKVKFLNAFVGGIFTTLLFQITKWGFTFYVGHFANYRLLYGALATIPIFLVWLYVAWSIVLFGALITNFLEEGKQKK